MAEVTKRKIATIYSMLLGFALSLFSGRSHAGEMFLKTSQLNTTKKAQTVNVVTDPSSAHMKPASPTTTSSSSAGTTAHMRSPAPDSSTINSNLNTAGHMRSPSPDSDVSGEVINAEAVGDFAMRDFITQKAVDQGKNPNQLSSQDFNTFRTDFLELKVQALEQQLQKLNEQNLPH